MNAKPLPRQIRLFSKKKGHRSQTNLFEEPTHNFRLSYSDYRLKANLKYLQKFLSI
ncbi:hypothetical protein BH09BAC3_BH09BAC3_35870 [soil metagenome]